MTVAGTLHQFGLMPGMVAIGGIADMGGACAEWLGSE